MNEVELVEGWVKLVDTTATDTVALPHQFEAVLRNAYQKMTSEYIAGNVSPATAFYVATVYSCIPSLFNELDGEPIYAALCRLLESVCEPVAA